MKCLCCDNRIWIEQMNSKSGKEAIMLMTRKQLGDIETGIILNRGSAMEFAINILNGIGIGTQMMNDGTLILHSE